MSFEQMKLEPSCLMYTACQQTLNELWYVSMDVLVTMGSTEKLKT